MSNYQLGKSIEILNTLPWFSDMYFATIAEAEASAVKHVAKLFYVADQTNPWSVFDSSGNVLPFEPQSDEITALENNLNNAVTTLTNGINSKASQVEVDGIQSDLLSKAPQSQVDSLTSYVDSKAAQGQVDSIQSELLNKASQSQVDSLTTYVDSKAAQAQVDALSDDLSTLGDNAVTTAQLTSATSSLQSQIDTINASLADAGALNRDVTAKGVSSILGIEDGTVFSTGLTFSDWFESFMRRFKLPALSLASSPATVEVGSTLGPTLTATYTPNDGGLVNNVTFTRGGTELQTGSTSLTHTDDDAVVVGEETVNYGVLVDYDEVTGQVAAGSVSASCNVYGKYRLFALTEASTPGTVDSNYVRTNNAIGAKYKGTSSYSLDVSGAKYVAIVCPPGITLNTTNTKNPGTNEKVFDGITPTTIEMSCAGSATATYNIYVKETAVAWSAGATFNVVLNS